MIAVSLSLAVSLLVLCTVLPLSKAEIWWVRSLDFPRLLFTAMAFVLAILVIVAGGIQSELRLFLLGLICLCAAYQLYWIFPYTILKSPEVPWVQADTQPEKFSVLCANVLMSNRNAQGLLELIEATEPTIIITLETNAWWEQQLASLEESYTYVVKCAQENLYGMHLYSRYELIDPKIEYLVAENIPSIHCKLLSPAGTLVRCHFLHPMPPAPGEAKDSGERDAELVMVAKSVADEERPVLVVGDLNDVAWSPTTQLFRKISGLLDPRVGRGLLNTFHADYWFLRWPLDHLFHSKHFSLCEMRRLPEFGSDHFALFTELALDNTSGHGELDATDEDKALAEEKMARQGVSEESIPE